MVSLVAAKDKHIENYRIAKDAVDADTEALSFKVNTDKAMKNVQKDKSSTATLETSKIEYGASEDLENRLRRTCRPQESSTATLHTSKSEYGDPAYLKNRVR